MTVERTTAAKPLGAAGGDLAGSYPSPSLAVIGVAATVGNATNVPVVSIDTKGRVTSLTTTAITYPVTTVFGRAGAVVLTAADIQALFTAAGQVFQGTGSGTGALALPPGYEIGYDQITAPVNVAATTEAGGTTIITCAAHTFDGGAVIAEISAPLVVTDTALAGHAVFLHLWEGSTEIARVATVQTPAAAQAGAPVHASFRFTPTAGAHTYLLKAHASSATGTPQVVAGASGVGAYRPAYVRFLKV